MFFNFQCLLIVIIIESSFSAPLIDDFIGSSDDANPLIDLACNTIDDCNRFTSADRNATCFMNQCACSTYMAMVPCILSISNEIGHKCPCNNIKNAICKNEICICKKNYMSTPDKKRCTLKKIPLGNICENDLQCKNNDPNAICNSINKTCTCQENFIQNRSICQNNVVLPQRLPENNMRNDDQRENHQQQLDNRGDNQQQHPLEQQQQQEEQRQQQQQQQEEQRQQQQQQQQQQEQRQQQQQQQQQQQWELGQQSQCKDNNQCENITRNSMCEKGKCICKNGFVTAFHNESCVEIAAYGDDCEDDRQCGTSMNKLGEGMVCYDWQCDCNEFYYEMLIGRVGDENETVCIKRVEIGATCKTNEDCFQNNINYTKDQSMRCMESICNCSDGFIMEKNHRFCQKKGGAASILPAVALVFATTSLSLIIFNIN